MKKTNVNQRVAATAMAYKFSDVMEFDSSFFADGRAYAENEYADRNQNLFGQQTKIFNCEGTEDVLGVMYGAMKGGAVASGFVKDTGFLNMSQLVNKYAFNDLPAVVYVATDDVNVCAYNFTKETGMVFPSNAQEAADLSVLAHLSIGKSYKPFVVCLNNRSASGAEEEIELPENNDINKLFDPVAFCGTRARALKRGLSCDIEVPILLEAELPEIVDYYLSIIAKEWGREYKLMDYVGSPNAEKVIVSAGTGTDVIEDAVRKMVADGKKVGLVKIKILAPFNAAKLAECIPETCREAILVGQTAGACPKNPLFAAVKDAAPQIKWLNDDYAIGKYDVTADYVEKAFDAFDMAELTATKKDDKYFVQGMDAKNYEAEKEVFDLGAKRWVIANSVAANNVNFGLGMTAAFEQRRDWILNEVLFLADNTVFPSVSEKGYQYLEVKDDTEKSLEALDILLEDKVGADTHCSTCTNIRQELEFLDKKYYWTYAGDSRLAPLDWCAIRKALSTGEKVNIFCVQDKAIYKKAADKTGALDVFFNIKNIEGVMAKTITLDMEDEKVESILHQAEIFNGPSIVVLFA